MMKSSNYDVVPGKHNQVDQMRIHTEKCKKEKNYESVNRKDEFSFNPYKTVCIASKPNYITPSQPFVPPPKIHRDDIVEYAFRNEAMKRRIENTLYTPKQKFRVPATASQEIGWHASATDCVKNERWEHPVQGNWITDWGSSYMQFLHINPFKVKGRAQDSTSRPEKRPSKK